VLTKDSYSTVVYIHPVSKDVINISTCGYKNKENGILINLPFGDLKNFPRLVLHAVSPELGCPSNKCHRKPKYRAPNAERLRGVNS
jgi:hypothetical protein